jgi:hypothetical protein
MPDARGVRAIACLPAAPHRVEALSAWAASELPDWAAGLAWIINARTP